MIFIHRLKFKPFSLQEILMNNKSNPEVEFYKNVASVEANYLLTTEVERSLTDFNQMLSQSFI